MAATGALTAPPSHWLAVMNLNNFKLSTRLSVAFATLTGLVVLLATVAFFQLGSISGRSQEITGNWLPSVEVVNQINTNTSDFRINEWRHVVAEDAKQMAAVEADMTTLAGEFDRMRQQYVALISSPEERAIYDQFDAKWKQYMQVHDRMIEASRKNETEASRLILEGESRTLFTDASANLMKLVALNHDGAMAAAHDAESAYQRALVVLGVVVGLAVLIAVTAAVTLIRSTTGPLAQAVRVAESVAGGDLTARIDRNGRDEISQLMGALGRMQSSLQGTVVNVRGNAEGVATASAQIAQGNADLSQRTEEQASALQQTAATMDELSSTVRHNAENAQQANQLAITAAGVASDGGTVVGQVVQTMKEINASSQRIADIIGVIDGIAFQTNILALNAAVEAARAGEQGRGFAVVAGEVRTLAQRSAEAAREIKTLINSSVEQVEQGTNLVDRAGKTMGEIVNSIQRVADIVGEISSASHEQADGVGQVTQAITQMDQVTQQNAALVEESAAAAESLRSQARMLVDAVAVFRTDGAAPGHTPAAAPARASAPLLTTRPAAARPGATRPAAPRVKAATAAPAPAPAMATADDWETF